MGDHEKFIDEKGNIFIENEIPERLGIDIMGLRFSNIIDMYFNEEEPLNENIDKNKKFLTNLMGIDFTGNIEQITSSYDVPMSFDEGVGPELIKRWLNYWGPMYLVNIKGKKYLYQDRGDFEMFLDEKGFDYVDNEILEELGIDVMGLRFSNIIDLYFKEEDL
jgi:3D (Asp-Asp-Asp) domain-containing protein